MGELADAAVNLCAAALAWRPGTLGTVPAGTAAFGRSSATPCRWTAAGPLSWLASPSSTEGMLGRAPTMQNES